MSENWYVPPRRRPLEVAPRVDDVSERRFLHVDGPVGEPATAVVLSARHGSSGRVVVQTAVLSVDSWSPVRRIGALARLCDLAGLGLPAGGWETLEAEAASTRWSRFPMSVDGREEVGEAIEFRPGLWCALGTTEDCEVTVFGAGPVPDRIDLRPVGDWSPYGVALDVPQPLTSLPWPELPPLG